MSDLNRVTLVGRLTRDPEVRHTAGGMPIVSLGLAVNGRKKDAATGQWTEKPNFFDVSMFGDRFERLAQYLEKGKRVGIDGRLEFSQWETDGQKRSKVEIVANELQFLDSRGDDAGSGNQFQGAESSTPDTTDFVPVGASAGNDDDIPF